MGARSAQGRYGKISIRSTRRDKHGVFKIKAKLAHRVSREVFKGEFFRRGQYGRHMCAPHPNRTLCVNPDHVWPGTPRQNNRQTVAEGRHSNKAKKEKGR